MSFVPRYTNKLLTRTGTNTSFQMYITQFCCHRKESAIRENWIILVMKVEAIATENSKQNLCAVFKSLTY